MYRCSFNHFIMWQDTVLFLINFGFIFTLLPAIIKNYQHKEVEGQSLLTYISTAVLLSIMAYVFLTLDFLLSALSSFGTAITWYILLYQRVHYAKNTLKWW